MFTYILTRILQIQFVRQLFGAVGGALIALVVYTAYRGAQDTVRAYLVSPDADQAVSVTEVKAGEMLAFQDAAVPTEEGVIAQEPEVSPSPVTVEAKAAPAPPADATHAGAPNLPRSGIGLWIAAFIALSVSFVSTRRLRMFLLSAQSRVD